MSQRNTSQIQSLIVGGKHCWATLWTVERTDGVVFRFTDHDREVTLDGLTYTPAGAAVSASARQHIEGVEPQNLEIRGAVTSSYITEEDLAAGLYRGAKVTEIVVDWRFPWAGHFVKNIYYIDETTFSMEAWTAQLKGMSVRLRPEVGAVYTRSCRWKLGDSRCLVDISGAPFATLAAVVVSVTNDRVFTTSLSSADNFFADGYLLWSTGPNAGTKSPVKKSLATGAIELQLPTPFPVSIGHQFDAIAGCDKRFTTCKSKFNNALRFGGFPYIPGNDDVMLTPDLK